MHPRRRRTPRRPGVRGIVVLLLGAITLAFAPAGHAAPRATDQATPLRVVLSSMSPSVVPAKGPLTMRGRVKNVSQETWRDINVSAFASSTPITSAAELDDAAATPADAYVGERLVSTDAFVPIGDLGPGDTATFILRIPRAELDIPDEPGVYWIGVHALGTDAAGRDDTADGRARTFIPLLKARQPRVDVSLVLPFRQPVRRNAALSLIEPKRWARQLSSGGRLGRLLDLAESAGGTPLSLLVDPAVLDAARTVGDGNIVDPSDTDSGDQASSSPSASASPDNGSDNGSDNNTTTPPADTPTAKRARSWLKHLVRVADGQQVLGLGYADPDVAALSHADTALLHTSQQASARAFRDLDVSAIPAVAPADGVLPDDALTALDADTTVLLGDGAARGSAVRRTSSVGQTVVLADTAAASGGPAPGPTMTALAMRQRIIAEAAVHALSGSKQPLVVDLPASWDPGPGWQAADFFGGLRTPWLRSVPLDTSAGGGSVGSLSYPASAAAAQIEPTQVHTARRIQVAADVYANTLTDPGDTARLLDGLALGAVSYHGRSDPSAAASDRVLPRAIRARLDGIRVVVVDDLVTMSGKSGLFTVTLVNELDRSVRVGVRAFSAPDLRITAPRPAVLAAGQRTTVRLKAHADATGVRVVNVSPVNGSGDRVGTPVRFSVRSSQVSSLVWGVMAGAFALLFGTILRRAVRRGLKSRREAG